MEGFPPEITADTKGALKGDLALTQEKWLEKAAADQQRIESGQTTLRLVLREWAGLVYEKERESKVDSLTRIFNRKAFDEALPRVADFCRKEGVTLGIMFFDVDDFGMINKEKGWSIGDEVLRRVAQAFKASVRFSDHPARYGGEEFVALLPGVTEEDLAMIAERTRANIEAIEPPRENLYVTASVGATLMGEGELPGNALNRAQEAAKEAKKEGKNKAVNL